MDNSTGKKGRPDGDRTYHRFVGGVVTLDRSHLAAKKLRSRAISEEKIHMQTCFFCKRIAKFTRSTPSGKAQPLCRKCATAFGHPLPIAPQSNDINEDTHEFIQWVVQKIDSEHERRIWKARLQTAFLTEPLSKPLHRAIEKALYAIDTRTES